MQYALLYYETTDEVAKRTRPSDAETYWAGWGAYMDLLSRSGSMRGGNVLEPAPAATHVKVQDGGRVVEDGPYADAREELGGFIIVEAANLDEALALAEGAPCARAGHVEVRPVYQPPSRPAA